MSLTLRHFVLCHNSAGVLFSLAVKATLQILIMTALSIKRTHQNNIKKLLIILLGVPK